MPAGKEWVSRCPRAQLDRPGGLLQHPPLPSPWAARGQLPRAAAANPTGVSLSAGQMAMEALEEEKQSLRGQISQVLEDRQQLMHLKMSLSLEVATYR